jgi:hypothetical protein
MYYLIKNVSLTAFFICLLTQAIPSAMAASFFVDKGHTDVVEGVAFEIVSPHLFIKKAFKLRGENLTPSQLLLIREAMPAIAGMTQQILLRPLHSYVQAPQNAALLEVPQPRNIYQLQDIESPVQLFIQTIKNWQVTESSIQFSSDYFYRPERGHTVNFRDTYLFTKANGSWRFMKHPNSMPDGVLQCAQNLAGWMRCDLAGQQ